MSLTGSQQHFPAQSNGQNFEKAVQQLGQDLSSGNLSQAQADL
jgi:hypothetical protein